MRTISRTLRPLVEAAVASGGPYRWPWQRSRLWILMYHRVLPKTDTRWGMEEPGMLVTPETLRHHIQWIREDFELVRLHEWLEDVRAGKPVSNRAVALTFDDGWRDNFEYALPVLNQERASATVFLVSQFVGTNRSFWPNRLARVLRHAHRRTSDCQAWRWLSSELRFCGEWNPETAAKCIAKAKTLQEVELLRHLEEVEASLSDEASERSIVNWAEAREMVLSGCFDVGSHGCSHRRLKRDVGHEELLREIACSKRQLEQKLGKPVSMFCYPNGDASQEAEALVREHYLSAVTTRPGCNSERTDPFRLRRIALHEDIASTRNAFLARLNGV